MLHRKIRKEMLTVFWCEYRGSHYVCRSENWVATKKVEKVGAKLQS